jgi:hypothetical protein
VSIAALTTISRDGYPQTSVVSCDFDRGCVRANTMRGFAKGHNILRDPRVSLLCYDPGHPFAASRSTVVEMTETGAARHLDTLASKYTGRRDTRPALISAFRTSRLSQRPGSAATGLPPARRHHGSICTCQPPTPQAVRGSEKTCEEPPDPAGVLKASTVMAGGMMAWFSDDRRMTRE